MPRVPMSLLLHLLRADGRGRRRHGVAGLWRFRRHMRDLRRFRRGGWNRQDRRRYHRNGAGPSHQPAPLHPEVPAWLLAGPAAATPGTDGNVDPALAAPPSPFWCPEHGWVVCPRHQYDSAVVDAPLEPPTPVVVEEEPGAPLPISLTVAHTSDAPLVQVHDGDALAFVSAPAGASVFVFGSGVGGSSNHAVVDADAVAPRLPSPTPATPPCSPRGGARRHVMALGVPPASSPSSRHCRIWSAAALGLASCAANGVASSHGLLGDSSSKEDDGALGPSAHRR